MLKAAIQAPEVPFLCPHKSGGGNWSWEGAQAVPAQYQPWIHEQLPRLCLFQSDSPSSLGTHFSFKGQVCEVFHLHIPGKGKVLEEQSSAMAVPMDRELQLALPGTEALL